MQTIRLLVGEERNYILITHYKILISDFVDKQEIMVRLFMELYFIKAKPLKEVIKTLNLTEKEVILLKNKILLKSIEWDKSHFLIQ